MRKRKLYVSELLKRCKNKNLRVYIQTIYGDNYFESVKSCIEQNKFLDEQVKYWEIYTSNLFIII